MKESGFKALMVEISKPIDLSKTPYILWLSKNKNKLKGKKGYCRFIKNGFKTNDLNKDFFRTE
jgi:hypothetical protein